MPGDPDPLDLVTGLTSPVDVSKPQTVAYLKSDLHWFATASSVRALDLSARTRIMIGSRFFRKDTSDLSADDGTETSLVVIDGAGTHWLVIEGERYDLQYSGTGQIGSDEGLNPGFAPTPLELLAGLPGSFWYAIDAVPTNQNITSFKKSLDKGATWTQVFTATIAAGQRAATFSLAADVTLPAGAILRPFGPTIVDPTLETVGGVIAARR